MCMMKVLKNPNNIFFITFSHHYKASLHWHMLNDQNNLTIKPFIMSLWLRISVNIWRKCYYSLIFIIFINSKYNHISDKEDASLIFFPHKAVTHCSVEHSKEKSLYYTHIPRTETKVKKIVSDIPSHTNQNIGIF